MSLVVPYRGTLRPRTTAEPLHAVATHDSAVLVEPAAAAEGCHFRMLQPREHLRAQRFHDAYVVQGNKSEQTMRAGNAVPCNVTQWLCERIAAALDGHDAGEWRRARAHVVVSAPRPRVVATGGSGDRRPHLAVGNPFVADTERPSSQRGPVVATSAVLVTR